MNALLKKYYEEICNDFKVEFKLKNFYEIPKLEKMVVSIGLGEAIQNSKVLQHAENDLRIITSQKPIITHAKRSIAGFKLKEGMPIGVKVTLRNKRMYNFLEKLVHIVLPRVRDFRGLSLNGFDNFSNYTLGIKEQIVFPEINIDNIDKIRGLSITFVTTVQDKAKSVYLLKNLGLPFKK